MFYIIFLQKTKWLFLAFFLIDSLRGGIKWWERRFDTTCQQERYLRCFLFWNIDTPVWHMQQNEVIFFTASFSFTSNTVWCCTRNESKLPENHSLLRPGVRGRGVLLTGRAFISAATSSSSAWWWRLLLDLQDSCTTTTNQINNENCSQQDNHHHVVLKIIHYQS